MSKKRKRAPKRAPKRPKHPVPKRPKRPAPASTPPSKAAKRPAKAAKPTRRPTLPPKPPKLTRPRNARQALARKRALAYINRLGLRKAAQRLFTNVTDLNVWLKTGFPASKIELAYGLGKPGGSFTQIKGTRLAKFIQEKGLRRAATLTGIPGKELLATAKTATARVRLKREILEKLRKKHGTEGLAKLFGTRATFIKAAVKVPHTQATVRLRAFVDVHGVGPSARFLGLTSNRLSLWLKRGIPRNWEADVAQLIGRRSTQGPSADDVVAARERRPVKTVVASARKQVAAWNKGKLRRYQIRLADAERWARLGNFRARFDSARSAYQAALTPGKPKPTRQPPRKAPKRPIIPPEGLPPPPTPDKKIRPPKPPKKPPTKPLPLLEEQWRSRFLQARADGFIDGQYPRPQAPWNIIQKWIGLRRWGHRTYRKVEKFVHEIDLDKLAQKIIATALKLWKMPRDGHDPLLTIRFCFSMLGVGNPFYPESFHATDSVAFPIRNVETRSEPEIVRETLAIVEEIYVVNAHVTPLFLEYYEIVKSVAKPKQEQPEFLKAPTTPPTGFVKR